MLRIEHLIDKPVSGLSSGDRQRVALGPRDRAPAAGLPDGRAARRARLRVPRADVPGAARAARPPARHHRLRHARPARGDGDGRHDRDHEPGRDRAARRAAGRVRPAGQRVRGRLHRLAGDELPALRRRRCSRRRSGSLGERCCRFPRCAKTPRAPSCCSACGPSMCACRWLGAARRGAGHRVPRHQPDRHLHDRAGRDACAPRSTSTCRCSAATRSAWPSMHAVSLFDQASGRALRTARHDAADAPRRARARCRLGAAHG